MQFTPNPYTFYLSDVRHAGMYFGQKLGVGIFSRFIWKCTATRVASLLYLTPPTTMLMDYFIFGNMVTVNGMFGLVIVTIGVVLTHRGEQQKS